MKKFINIFIITVLILTTFSIKEAFAGILQPNSNILVAYFSLAGEQYAVGEISEGNTAKIAKLISKYLNADLFEIKPVKNYPNTYLELDKTAKYEKEKNLRPAISRKPANWDKYGIVFVGFPIWHGDMPMPVYTFLESNDFKDKTIIPFCTHEGNGIAGIAPWIRAATHAKYVHRGFDMRGYIAQYDEQEAKNIVLKWTAALK